VFTDVPTVPAQKVCLQRIGSDGSLRWPLDGIQVDTIYNWAAKFSHRVVQDDEGVITIGWMVKYNGVLTYDVFVQSIDTSGMIKWQAGGIHVTGSLSNTDYSLVETKDHKAIVLYPASRNEYRAQYFDSTGLLAWSDGGVPVNHGPHQDNSGVHGVADNGNGAIVIYAGTQHTGRHIYGQRLNETGGLGESVLTDVNEGHSTLPTEFELMQNYPNPFNPRTVITFRLPVSSNVTLRVYNVLGQVVKELANTIETAGEHSVVWNTSLIASGVYFYRIEATSIADPSRTFTQVKKSLLLK
jgi:hypothetical protein